MQNSQPMKTMIKAVLLLAISVSARTASGQSTFSQSYFPDLTIPEGNPVGVADRGGFDAAPAGGQVADVTINLFFTGGYNGDLYVALLAPDGTSSVLLDQPGVGVNGFGAAGAGMNITLSDTATNSIQSETSDLALTGAYQPAQLLAMFQGLEANGTWVIYCANLGIGDGPTTLVSWGINITTVPTPEPASGELGAVAMLIMMAVKYRINPKA